MEFVPWSFNQKNKPSSETLNLVGPTSLYIYDVVRNRYINLPVMPESVSASYTASLQQLSSFGILHPVNYYIGGSAKTISFAIDIHEDLTMDYTGRANTERNNLYHMLDILKAMSESSVANGKLEPPQVYLQLGNQFAGKGHIETSISLATPYRNGRYVLANIGITFTFHDSFKSSELDIISREPGSLTIGLGVSDLKGLGVTEENFKDFFEENFNIDAILRRTLADSKLHKLAYNYATVYSYQLHVSGAAEQQIKNLEDSIYEGDLSGLAFYTPFISSSGVVFPSTYVTFPDVEQQPYSGESDISAGYKLLRGLTMFKVIMTGNYYTEQTKTNLLELQTEIKAVKKQYAIFRANNPSPVLPPSDYEFYTKVGDKRVNIPTLLEDFKDSTEYGLATLLGIIDTQLRLYDFSESEE